MTFRTYVSYISYYFLKPIIFSPVDYLVTLCLTILEYCVTKRGSLMDLLHVPSPDSNNPQCQVSLSGETPEVDVIVRQAMSHHHNDLKSVADSLYQLANAKLVGYFKLF